MTETIPLFAIPLGVTQVSSEICDQIKPLQGQEQIQSNPDCRMLDSVPALKQEITDIFAEWANDLHGTPDQKWVMTTSWVTKNTSGVLMNSHRHFNCMYSGVIYFDKVDEQHPPLIFQNPLQATGSILLRNYGQLDNVYTSIWAAAPMVEGLMIMFPSYLMHSHQSFMPSNVARKSLACNFFPVGSYGSKDSSINTTWLNE